MSTPEESSAPAEEAAALQRRVEEARRLGRDGDDETALTIVDAVTARLQDGDRPDGDRVLAFAQLTRVSLLIGAERLEEAGAAATGLLAVFTAQEEQAPLAGFGAMVLDACFWLLSAGRDHDALALADALVQRLAGDDDATRRAVGAGGRFFAAQAAGRLGQTDRAREQISLLCEMGDPALAALDRIAGQFGGAEANPAWHAQIAAAAATVLWRTGRGDEARALADDAAQRFGELGLPQLRANLRALAREIAADD